MEDDKAKKARKRLVAASRKRNVIHTIAVMSAEGQLVAQFR